MQLSLVIPCYNEEKSLPGLVQRCRHLTQAQADVEVILVDNGSTDNTYVVLENLLAGIPSMRSVRVPVNQGYGHGVLAGLASAKGSVLGWTHADMQTDPMDVKRGFELLKSAEHPAKVYVKGRRYGRPLSDGVFTAGMSLFETLLFGLRLNDINAQPNLFHRSFYETWKDPPNDFALDLFVYVSARRAGLCVKRFPVLFGKRAFGMSHWNISWRAKVKFIRRTASFSWKLRGQF